MSKLTGAIVVVIVIIILGIVSYVEYGQYQANKEAPTASSTEKINKHYSNTEGIDLIVAKHQYDADSGKHYIAGTLKTPTLCDILKTDTKVNEDTDPVTATILFTLTNTADTCTQAIGEARFKVSFTAPEDANIVATLNGQPIKLNLVPVPEGEDISDFPLYIKG